MEKWNSLTNPLQRAGVKYIVRKTLINTCFLHIRKVQSVTNQAKQVLGYTLISEGGITETCADIRVILQAALLTNSVAIILAHNHPSGNLKPSRQDMEITKQVKEAARLMRIIVTDHLILTDAGYYSFADEGEL